MSQPIDNQEVLDLLAEQATQGLDEDGQARLSLLLSRRFDLTDGELEVPAAMVELAMMAPEKVDFLPLPLRRKIEVEGRAIVREDLSNDGEFETPVSLTATLQQKGGWKRAIASPWMGLATAATLFLALGWFMHYANSPLQTQCYTERVSSIVAMEQRDALLSVDDAVVRPWAVRVQHPGVAQAHGEIAWSAEHRRGIVQLKGLNAENLPPRFHLWIVGSEDEEAPKIDGGILDIDASGEVMVAINWQGGDVRPLRFELTVEEPDPTEEAFQGPVLVASLDGVSLEGASVSAGSQTS